MSHCWSELMEKGGRDRECLKHGERVKILSSTISSSRYAWHAAGRQRLLVERLLCSSLIIRSEQVKQHETQIRVRYEDADPMGFLHHAKYFTYFEIGRMDLFRSSGGNYRELEESGTYAVVVDAHCRYRKPARFDDLLIVQTTLAKITMVKIQYQYEMFRDQESLASAQVTLALVDKQGVVQPVPEWMQELL